MVTNYKDLEIWQKAMLLCEKIYAATRSLPKEEIYGLTSQMRRAAVSVSANIAEGFARNSNLDFKRFLNIAKGSLVELETHLEIAGRLEYLPKIKVSELFESTDILGKMMTRFVQNMH